jgi:hypothetical protein
VNCLQLQVLNYLKGGGESSKRQRYLIILYRSAWNGILIDSNVKQLFWEQTGILSKDIILVYIKKILFPT